MNTIFSWLRTEISSQNKTLVAINWKAFLTFPFSIYKRNKAFFFVYLLYLWLFFCLDTGKFVKKISLNTDTMVFLVIVIEAVLRGLFLPIILYFCIDKSRLNTDFTDISRAYKSLGFVLLGFTVLLGYDYGSQILFLPALAVSLICFMFFKIRTINLVLFAFWFQIALYVKFCEAFVRDNNKFTLVYLVGIYFIILLIIIYDKFNTKDKKCLH